MITDYVGKIRISTDEDGDMRSSIYLCRASGDTLLVRVEPKFETAEENHDFLCTVFENDDELEGLAEG